MSQPEPSDRSEAIIDNAYLKHGCRLEQIACCETDCPLIVLSLHASSTMCTPDICKPALFAFTAAATLSVHTPNPSSIKLLPIP